MILDHSDNHNRFGFVTDVDYETLDDGKEPPRAIKKPEDRRPNECPSCGYLKDPGIHECPECGFAPARKSLTTWKEGDLVAIKGRDGSQIDRAQFYGELKQIALDRGYKPGWAWHKFHEKFGEYPTYLNHAEPVPPSAATLAWVKSRVIAFAKARQRYG